MAQESPDFFELSSITIDIGEKPCSVCVADYVAAKTKDLKEFGYNKLTEDQVLASVRRVVNKEKLIDVIDHFVKSDIILDDAV